MSNVTVVMKVGLIAGTLDIFDALLWNLFHGIGPKRVFQYIASGLIGGRALELGLKAVVLGILLHYIIATAWTAIFYLLSRRWRPMLEWPVISGFLYGLCVYVVMNFIVLPLSAVAPRAQTLGSRLNSVLALLVCMGVALALMFRHWLPPSIAE